MSNSELCPCCGQSYSPQNARKSDFEIFWKAYPRKTGKGYCHDIWKRKKFPAIEIIIEALKKSIASPDWQKEGGKFIPNPSTWLNQGRWEDEGIDYSVLSQKIQKPIFKGATASVDPDAYRAWKIEEGYPSQFIDSSFQEDIEPVQRKYLATLKP
jgi:hypothetical protein